MDVTGTVISIVSLCVKVGGFTKKAYEIGCEIQDSADGATKDHSQIERLVKATRSYTEQLAALVRENDKVIGKIPDADFRGLYREYVEESRRLLEKLEALRPSSNTRNKRWQKTYSILASVWQDEKIQKQYSKVEKLNLQLTQYLIVISNLQNHEIDRSAKWNYENVLTQSDTDDDPWHTSVGGNHVPSKKDSLLKPAVMKMKAHLQSLQGGTVGANDLKDLQDRLLKFQADTTHCEIEAKIISQLWYTDYQDKLGKMESQMARKERSDCAWIYDQRAFATNPGNDDFSTWLREGSGMYWITGKPGSGKSMLMDFVSGDRRTISNLQCWSGSSTLVVASFFFSYRGPSSETSHAGLLQSLLYEIVKANPALVKTLFSTRWKAVFSDQSFNDKVSETELNKAVTKLIALCDASYRFCFFIDGLDEYGGSHPDMIATVRRMTEAEHVKICVASRPWTDFVEAFKEDPTLRVHEMSQDNMRTYINNSLESMNHWMVLRGKDQKDAEHLISLIVEKAEGVFLWVFYVMRSLGRAIQGFSYIKQIRAEVKRFPRDLTSYYEEMFKRLDDEQNSPIDSKKIFLVALCSPQPLIGLVYWYLYDRRKRPKNNDARERNRTASFWISKCCQDVLEVYIENGDRKRVSAKPTQCRRPAHARITENDHFVEYITKVDFLHRTIRDYLESSEGNELVKVKPVFDPLDYIIQTSIALLKDVSSGSRSISRVDALRSIMHPVLSVIVKLTKDDNEPAVNVLEELDSAADQSSYYKGKSTPRYWTLDFDESCNDFLSLAVVLQLKGFVLAKITGASHGDYASNDNDLLALALRGSHGASKGSYQMIELLLDAGINPTKSHWRAWLRFNKVFKGRRDYTSILEEKIDKHFAESGYGIQDDDLDSITDSQVEVGSSDDSDS